MKKLGRSGGPGEDESSSSSSSSSSLSYFYEGLSNYVQYVSDTRDSAWKYAQDTSEGAQSQVTGWVSSVIYGSSSPTPPPQTPPLESRGGTETSSWWWWGSGTQDADKNWTVSFDGAVADSSHGSTASSLSSTRGNSFLGRFQSSSTLSPNPTASSPRRSPSRLYPELQWLLRNPYDNVLGRPYHVGVVGGRPSSLHAVRSLLTLVPELQQEVIPEGDEEEDDDDEEEEDEAWAETKKQKQEKPIKQNAGVLIVEGKEEEEQEDEEVAASKVRNSYLADSFLSTGEEEQEVLESATGRARRRVSKTSRRKLKKSRTRRPSPATLAPPAETASRLAGGTLRALRDMALDEASELRSALQYWAERWERPLLSWLEAGPWIWFSSTGYNHQIIGRKVSQLQAVLARRCAAIGEVQQHLLRAGWQRGVAQWGVLGQGGPWATVTGGDGRMMADVAWWAEQEVLRDHALQLLPHAKRVGLASEHGSDAPSTDGVEEEMRFRASSTNSTTTRMPTQDQKRRRWLSQQFNNYHETAVMVQNTRDGGIITNEAALASWSVDAIRVVRDQLYRAGDGGLHPLPHYESWYHEVQHFDDQRKEKQQQPCPHCRHDVDFSPDDDQNDETGMPPCCVPQWATRVEMEADDTLLVGKENVLDTETTGSATETPLSVSKDPEQTALESSASITLDQPRAEEKEDVGQALVAPQEEDSALKEAAAAAAETRPKTQPAAGIVHISNLPLMAFEVNDLLNTMEGHMMIQRRRRLEKLRPLTRFRRLWYVVAASVPLLTYVGYKALRGELTQHIVTAWIQALLSKMSSIYAEHLADPLRAIYRELFTRRGRESYTDRKARMDSIVTLQKMLRSWLDEMFPAMSEDERKTRAANMDVSLVEERKEASIKNIYEITNIMRMSLIEMQFIKKELMNAMGAMDELMGANEINMKLAAMTPAFLLTYGARYGFRVVRYALFKIGKSREETYASFRQLILDIERLLVMRDNPPLAKPAELDERRRTDGKNVAPAIVLNADDLGMLMLLVHECRRILWQDCRRFSALEIRNVSEDLAELAGERGVVSVSQQLQIVSRMCRTYSFLKVLSTGLPFNLIRQS